MSEVRVKYGLHGHPAVNKEQMEKFEGAAENNLMPDQVLASSRGGEI
jgi:hypothetical protein